MRELLCTRAAPFRVDIVTEGTSTPGMTFGRPTKSGVVSAGTEKRMTVVDDERILVLPLPALSFADPAGEQRFLDYYNEFYYRYAQFRV
jgi:hypothetical protein